MFRRKSILREWSVSYALILLIPIITIFINYNFNVRELEDEMQQAYELMLDNLSDNIDQIAGDQQKLYNQIYLDTVLEEFMSFSMNSDSYGYEIYQLQQHLSLYEMNGDTISFWVYLMDTEHIILNSEAYRQEYIYSARAAADKSFPTYEYWKKALTADYRNKIFFCDALDSEICLTYASSYNYRGKEGANILITTKASTFEDITSSLPKGAVLGIYIQDESLAWKNRGLYIDGYGVLTFPEDTAYESFEEIEAALGLEDYVKLSEESLAGKLLYHLFVPEKNLQDGARYIRKVHLISLMITCLVGIGLVCFLIRRNSKPVYRLLEIVGGEGKSVNEFEWLKDAYSHMKRENISMKEMIRIQKKNLTGSYLLSILKGRGVQDNSLEKELGMKLSCENSSFILVGVSIPLSERDGDAEYDELVFFVTDNIMSELMEKEEFCYAEDGGVLFYLFRMMPERAESWEADNLDKLNYLCDILGEKMNINLTVVVSSAEREISRAKHMYQSVMMALEYRSVLGGSGVIRVEDISDSDENGRHQKYNRKIVHALEAGELEIACQISDKLFAASNHLPLIALRLRVLEAYQAIADSYNTYTDDSIKRMQLMAKLENLLNATTREEVKERFEEILFFVHARMKGQWAAESKGLAEIVKEYVEKNYTDCNLNIGSIADGVGRNSRYLSTAFKKETGEGVLDYVNTLRIRKAQEVLLTSKISLEEVALIVGYSNVRTFRRAFVKVTGMVPSSYLEKK